MAFKLLGDFDAVNLTSNVPASAAICSSSSNSCGGGRAIDRHSPHLKDPLREKYFNPLLSRFYSKAKSNKQRSRKNTEKCPQSISPASSSRFLLNDSPVFGDFNDTEANPSVTPTESSKFESSKGEDLTQVVVLRVSLHCKGCERKVRKHIAKMKGVTSFSTDLAAKKVTVVGDVTPLSVLNSVSKVKNAQFWPSHS